MSKDGKKGRLTLSKIFIRILFSRVALFILLILLQVYVIFSIFAWLSEYMIYIYGAFLLLSVLIIVHILNSRENPEFKLAWTIPVAIIPVFGALLYLFFKIQPVTLLVRRRSRKQETVTLPTAATPPDGLFRYLEKLGYPTYRDTHITYFPLGEIMFEEMVKQMNEAKQFIFLEYFIIAEGRMWDVIREILERKAAEGVEVRILYDGMGSLGRLPMRMEKTMSEKGIHCQIFAPVYPALSTLQNNRDHRKILVVDGKVGFTGGINIADEYINENVRCGHWKDTGVMLRGNAVNMLTVLFLRNWSLYNKRQRGGTILPGPYLRSQSGTPNSTSDGFVATYGDSPFDQEDVGKRVYLDILNTAQEYAHIMTPYLILDSEILEGLRFAVKRGVDVVLMLPYINDSWISSTVALTYYRELLEAGVNIYEYLPGMVHSKLVVSDNRKAVVGTMNLDYRSMFLHFECGCYFSESAAVSEIEQDFQTCLRKCRCIETANLEEYTLLRRCVGRICRLFAPLL